MLQMQVPRSRPRSRLKYLESSPGTYIFSMLPSSFWCPLKSENWTAIHQKGIHHFLEHICVLKMNYICHLAWLSKSSLLHVGCLSAFSPLFWSYGK